MDEFLQTKLFVYDEDSTTGYIFCLRMHVPPELHDNVDFAPICKAVINDTKKLFPHLGERDYVATLPLLVRYHRLGVVFEEVCSAYSYRQAPYMREHLMLARTRAVCRWSARRKPARPAP